MIFQQIKKLIQPGIILQGGGYTVKGFGKKRDGEPTLVYRIRKRTAGKQSEKNIAASEWEQAYGQLVGAGEFKRTWFAENMPECARGKPCNFAVIGKVFVFLEIADEEPRKYVRRHAPVAARNAS